MSFLEIPTVGKVCPHIQEICYRLQKNYHSDHVLFDVVFIRLKGSDFTNYSDLYHNNKLVTYGTIIFMRENIDDFLNYECGMVA